MSMKKEYVYTGSWLDETGKKGGGIRIYEKKREEEGLELITVCHEEIAAGYICISKDKRYLYVTDEQKRKPDCVYTSGGIWVFRIHEDGTLTKLDWISSCGTFPNYLTIFENGRTLFAVNYGSEDIVVRSYRDDKGKIKTKNIYDESSIIMISIQHDGKFGNIQDIIPLDGEPSKFFEWFQSSPHAHCIATDPFNKMLLVADRGCEEILTFKYNVETCRMERFQSYETRRGIGPRNSAFHPWLPYVYVVGEIQPYIICYKYCAETGKLEEKGIYLTAEKDKIYQEGKSFFDCAHPSDIKIHPNGKRLYVANRGPDTIACYDISEKDGTLTHLADVCANGAMPWSLSFNSDGSRMYVGNKVSGTITLFSVDEKGIPHFIGVKIPAERIVCIKCLCLDE